MPRLGVRVLSLAIRSSGLRLIRCCWNTAREFFASTSAIRWSCKLRASLLASLSADGKGRKHISRATLTRGFDARISRRDEKRTPRFLPSCLFGYSLALRSDGCRWR